MIDDIKVTEADQRWGQDSLEAAVIEDDFWKRWAVRLFWLVVVLVCGLIFQGIWDHLDRRVQVEAFVQPIRISADGQVTLLEPAKPLREFIIPPEAIQFMLRSLVVDLRRLTSDPVVNEDARRNLLAAVCGPMAQTITTPAVRDTDLVAVNVDRVFSGASARTWHAEWQETWYDKRMIPKSEHLFRADLTLARRDLDWKHKDSMAIFTRNPISLCLQSVLIHEVPAR